MKKTLRLIVAATFAAFTFTAVAQIAPNSPPPQLTSADNAYSLTTLLGGNGVSIPATSTNVAVSSMTLSTSMNTNTIVSTNTWNVPAGYNIAANNNLMTVRCGESTNASVTYALTGTASSSGNLFVYQSQDSGRTFNPTPLWNAQSIAPGAAQYGTNFVLTFAPGTTLGFAFGNSGSTIETNVLLEVTTTAPKTYTIPIR